MKIFEVYQCDICEQEFTPVELTTYSPDVVSAIRIDGYQKPKSQSIYSCICEKCSIAILDTIKNRQSRI